MTILGDWSVVGREKKKRDSNPWVMLIWVLLPDLVFALLVYWPDSVQLDLYKGFLKIQSARPIPYHIKG